MLETADNQPVKAVFTGAISPLDKGFTSQAAVPRRTSPPLFFY
jgi:hypothetical protein